MVTFRGSTQEKSLSEIFRFGSVGLGLTVRESILAQYGFYNHDWVFECV